MKVRMALLLSWTLMAGCLGIVDEDNYAEKYSPLFCSKTKECYRGYYDSEWADMNDCIEDVRDQYEDVIDQMDDNNCDFEDKKAKECLLDLSDANCEDYFEGDATEDCAFNKVWDC